MEDTDRKVTISCKFFIMSDFQIIELSPKVKLKNFRHTTRNYEGGLEILQILLYISLFKSIFPSTVPMFQLPVFLSSLGLLAAKVAI